jgi:hypothetical protein
MAVKKFLPLAFFFCLLFAACKKNSGDANNTPPEPIKTGKGVASGTPVSKVIGSAGGELTSGDGKLKLVVAAGTVSANTEFFIQPITNTLFEGEARTAYRLLPEGTTFAKPVQLQFHYSDDDTLHTAEDLLTVAFQRSDGAWAVLPTSLNKAAKTLTTETTHFSDWAITGGLYLQSEETQLGLGHKTTIRVVSVSRLGLEADENVLAPAAPPLLPEDRDKIESINNWKIASGIGSIGVETGQLGKVQSEAEYSAPADMTQNRRTMTITVDVKGYNLIKDPAASGGVRRMSKMILFEHITVVKEFFKAVIGGRTHFFKGDEVVALLTAGGLTVGGRNDTLNLVILVAGSNAGSYNCNHDNGVQANYLIGTGIYSTGYTKCLGAGIGYVGTPIEIRKVGAVGEWIEGKYVGKLFNNLADPCAGAMPTVEADIEFNVFRER